MIVDGTPYCDVCGSDGPNHQAGLRIDFGKHEALTVTCPLCQGLLDAGLVRLDGIDDEGHRRFRQWYPVWTQGEMIPLPRIPAAADA